MPTPSYWFEYNSGPITDPLSYTKLNQQPGCCIGHTHVCAIYAGAQSVGGVLRPIISGTELQTEILTAINTKTPTASILLTSQPTDK